MAWSKMDMKKILSLVLLVSLMLGLAACGLPNLPKLPGKTPAEEQQPEPDTAPQEAAVEVQVPETPAPTPEPTPTPDPYADKPDIDINSWEFMLANSYNSMGEHHPPYSGFEGQGIHENMVGPLTEFVNAARAAGFQAYCSVLYRNYEFLESHYLSFRQNMATDAVDAANRMLGPGLNEHQTGLAVDFTDDYNHNAFYDIFEDDYMKDTDLYRWLVDNCTDYGFVLRYPEGKEAFYGVACNHPAHFRYVGKEAAKYMKEHDLCLEEFIMLYDESKVYLPQP